MEDLRSFHTEKIWRGSGNLHFLLLVIEWGVHIFIQTEVCTSHYVKILLQPKFSVQAIVLLPSEVLLVLSFKTYGATEFTMLLTMELKP